MAIIKDQSVPHLSVFHAENGLISIGQHDLERGGFDSVVQVPLDDVEALIDALKTVKKHAKKRGV